MNDKGTTKTKKNLMTMNKRVEKGRKRERNAVTNKNGLFPLRIQS